MSDHKVRELRQSAGAEPGISEDQLRVTALEYTTRSSGGTVGIATTEDFIGRATAIYGFLKNGPVDAEKAPE